MNKKDQFSTLINISHNYKSMIFREMPWETFFQYKSSNIFMTKWPEQTKEMTRYKSACIHSTNTSCLEHNPACLLHKERGMGPTFFPSEHVKAFGTYRSQVHYFSLNYELITRTNGSLKRSSKLLHYALNCCLLCT